MGSDVAVGPLGQSIGTSELEDNAVTKAKLAGGTAGKLLGFDGSGDPAELDSGLVPYASGSGSSESANSFIEIGSLPEKKLWRLVLRIKNLEVGAMQILARVNSDGGANFSRMAITDAQAIAFQTGNVSALLGYIAAQNKTHNLALEFSTLTDETPQAMTIFCGRDNNNQKTQMMMYWQDAAKVTAVSFSGDKDFDYDYDLYYYKE